MSVSAPFVVRDFEECLSSGLRQSTYTDGTDVQASVRELTRWEELELKREAAES